MHIKLQSLLLKVTLNVDPLAFFSTDFTNHPLNSHFSQSSFHSTLSSPLCPVEQSCLVPSYHHCKSDSSFHPYCPMCSVLDHFFHNFSILKDISSAEKKFKALLRKNILSWSSLFLAKKICRTFCCVHICATFLWYD